MRLQQLRATQSSPHIPATCTACFMTLKAFLTMYTHILTCCLSAALAGAFVFEN